MFDQTTISLSHSLFKRPWWLIVLEPLLMVPDNQSRSTLRAGRDPGKVKPHCVQKLQHNLMKPKYRQDFKISNKASYWARNKTSQSPILQHAPWWGCREYSSHIHENISQLCLQQQPIRTNITLVLNCLSEACRYAPCAHSTEWHRRHTTGFQTGRRVHHQWTCTRPLMDPLLPPNLCCAADRNVFLVDICSTQTQSTSGLNESLGCKQAALCRPIQTNTVHYQERRQTTDRTTSSRIRSNIKTFNILQISVHS